MVNYYCKKSQDKIKEALKQSGYTKDIPGHAFIQAMMVIFGMNEKTARSWMADFEFADIIINTYTDKGEWVINFKE